MISAAAAPAPFATKLGTVAMSRAMQEPAPRMLDTSALGTHLDRLYRAAHAMCGCKADAEDLVQDVCVRVLSKPRAVKGGDDRAYLLGVLRNEFISGYRKQVRRKTTPVEPASLAHVPASRRHDPELRASATEVNEAIAALPGQFRDVVVAVDVIGLSYAEAARALKVPEGTVMSRLHRGRAGVVKSVGR